MDCYFCIVNLPGKMGADVCVLAAIDDTAAMKAMTVQAAHWIGFETIFLYYGERFVGSLIDGHKGFPVSNRPEVVASTASAGSQPGIGSRLDASQPRPANDQHIARRAG